VSAPGGEWAWLDFPPAYERVPERFNMAPALVDRHLAAGRGGRPALVTPAGPLSYDGLHAGVTRAARALEALGVLPEQRVALLLPDSPAFVFAFLGAMRAGMVPVPLPAGGSVAEHEHALRDSRAAALVVHHDLAGPLEPLLLTLPALRHVLAVGGEPPGTVSFEAACAAEPAGHDPAPTHRDEPAYWLYSSGTTGRPKAVVHLHHDMLFCIEPYARHVLGLGPDDRTLAVPRLAFSYGLGSSLYLPLWAGASTVLVADRPAPRAALDAIARFRPTLFFSVPTALGALLREAEVGPADWSSLRLAVSAGEPLPAGLYQRWRERTGVECLDGLGTTEVGYIFVSNRPGAVRPGSSGRLLPGYRARVVDDEGRDAPAGTPGELWVAGESLAAGYWNRHARTRAAFVGEWYRTGDLYRVDEEGVYTHQGRVDDLLRVAGHWVSPLEVEACLLEHPAVAECAVVAGVDADGLPGARAFVVCRPGADAAGLPEALRAHAGRRLPRHKAPRWVVLVEALPRTPTGKVQRFRLRQAEG
jgi:benzoate-CoA ligase